MKELLSKYSKIPSINSAPIETSKAVEINSNETSFLNKSQTFELQPFKHVLFTVCHFNQEFYHSELFFEFGISFHHLLLDSVEKRQAEYLAGRICAKLTLENLKSPSSEVSIGEHRCPIWPQGFSGSITHKKNIALCAVINNPQGTSIVGIDLEKWLTVEAAESTKRIIICNEEEKIATKVNLPFEYFLTLAFSSKEALFKALFPKVGYYFGFHAAQITHINVQAGRFELQLTKSLSSTLTKGTIFQGTFGQYHEHIFTVIHHHE